MSTVTKLIKFPAWRWTDCLLASLSIVSLSLDDLTDCFKASVSVDCEFIKYWVDVTKLNYYFSLYRRCTLCVSLYRPIRNFSPIILHSTQIKTYDRTLRNVLLNEWCKRLFSGINLTLYFSFRPWTPLGDFRPPDPLTDWARPTEKCFHRACFDYPTVVWHPTPGSPRISKKNLCCEKLYARKEACFVQWST